MKNMIRFYSMAFALVVLASLIVPAGVSARPEIAARQNDPCWKCHVNPMGGGMRNATGFFFGQKSLAFAPIKEALDKKYPDFGKFVPAVNEKLWFGTDVRFMFHDQNYDKNAPQEVRQAGDGGTFFLMQADLYASASVLPILKIAYAYDAASNVFEAYGLIEDLPANSYIRIGRFQVPYGIRFDDHTIFTRDAMGFTSLSQDTGVEVGVRPGPFFLTAAATNGLMGQQAMDRDKDHYAITGQTGVRFWKLGVGGSYFHNTRDGLVRNVYGPWATFGVWKIALLGEVDLFNQDAAATTVPLTIDHFRGSASVAELDFEILQGIYLQGRYSHTDPDWAVRKNYMDQAMVGLTFNPMPFMHTMLQYRLNREDADINNNEIMAQAHFYF
jgi:hypothetical protein